MWGYGHLLEITQLSKSYNGVRVLSELSLTVEDKDVFGVLSVDREAMTALSELICGCENADAGEIKIKGETMTRDSLSIKKKVRLIPTALAADAVETPIEYLDFVGAALGVEPDKRYRQIKEALELTGIESVQNTLFSFLNASQRARLAIAAALIGNPDVIVADDAFSCIEGKQLDEIYEIIAMLGKIKTVVLMSHTPSEVKRLCKKVAIMCGGRIVLSGSVEEIEARINETHELHISVRGAWEEIRATVEKVEGVVDVRLLSSEKNNVNSVAVEYKPDSGMKDKLFDALKEINAPMLSVKQVSLTIDDVFYSLTDKDKKRIAEISEKPETEKKQIRIFGGKRR